jgi:hypothetical protein
MAKKYKGRSCDRFLSRLIKNKCNFLLKKGTEVDQIVYGDNHFLYATPNKNFAKSKLFLFKMVNDDVKKYLDENPFINQLPKKNTQEFNLDYDVNVGKITGTDLDHAYWRIAYVKGYISEKTYKHGIKDDKAKTIRLATLGNLGSELKFDEYVNGEYVKTIVERRENKAMKMVYKDIRYTCFFMMYEISKLLGNDFESWATDCIYYRDSAENRKIVYDYFDMHNMLYKQLTYNTMDFFEDEQEEETEEESNQETQEENNETNI